MNTIRAIALLAGAAVLAFGMSTPTDGSQGTWLACLAAAGALIGFGVWPRAGEAESEFSRPVINVVTTILLMFGLVAIQLFRMQLWASGAVSRQRGEDEQTGDVISNPREVNKDLVIDRGDILDRNGIALARTVRSGSIFVREFPAPDASYVAGYFSPLKFGKAGLEAAFDDYLSGEQTGNPLNVELDALMNRERRGADLRLTLDIPLQELAHRLLAGRTGAAVLLDARTGAVRALASEPHFDPATLVAIDGASAERAQRAWDDLNADERRPLLVRSTTGQYTPGSTFKTVTAAAAIAENVATPDTIYEDNGSLDVNGRIIIEENRPDDSIIEWSLREGLAFSLNVVFARVGLELGAERMRDYAGRFGFGSAAPFDVEVAPGQISNEPGFLVEPAALADTAFGQGQLLTTPLNMALVACAFANGGRMPRPYLVDRIVGPDRTVIRKTEPETWRRPVSSDVAEEVGDMMRFVVTDGYAGAAAIPGEAAGGKTGTAEIGDEDPHAWFIGFAGDPEPRFAVAVVLEHGGAGTGASIEIARELLVAALASD